MESHTKLTQPLQTVTNQTHLHVKGHSGDGDNEKADELVKKGAKLRFKLLESEGFELDPSGGWFAKVLNRYWKIVYQISVNHMKIMDY